MRRGRERRKRWPARSAAILPSCCQPRRCRGTARRGLRVREQGPSPGRDCASSNQLPIGHQPIAPPRLANASRCLEEPGVDAAHLHMRYNLLGNLPKPPTSRPSRVASRSPRPRSKGSVRSAMQANRQRSGLQNLVQTNRRAPAGAGQRTSDRHLHRIARQTFGEGRIARRHPQSCSGKLERSPYAGWRHHHR